MKDESTKEKHPSFGMIQFSRVSGAGRLFGSPLVQHFGTIRVRIAEGHRVHDHGNDYYRADDQIVEIELSAAQFAEAITCMNVGDGVPCTLVHIRGIGRIDDVPDNEGTEMARTQNAFKKKLVGVVDAVKQRGKTIAELMKKDRLSKDDRAKVNEIVDYVVREVAVNAPWWIEQFQEATDKVSSKAKAEIAAMFEHAIRQAGLQHFAALGQKREKELPALPAHEVESTK
jgi:hypothetical protein